AIDYKKWSGAELKSEFIEVFPDYDEERVYVSDIKKVYQWTNILLDNKLVDLEWANSIEEAKPVKEETPETTAK
ncbi:MAG: hypothetical protein ACI85Q_002032, partial [Salibacteraceae bacterium]